LPNSSRETATTGRLADVEEEKEEIGLTKKEETIK